MKPKAINARLLLAAAVLLTVSGVRTEPALAQTPFIGQIQFFPYNFAPRDWAFCNGQLLPIASNTALFSLIGTTFGGDGRSTFALPDMRGRSPIHPGRGPGLSERRWGQRGGAETVTLTPQQIPSHSHSLSATAATGNQASPAGHVLARSGRDQTYRNEAPDTDMHAGSITADGGGQAHQNMPPFLALNCNIALNGLFPPRS